MTAEVDPQRPKNLPAARNTVFLWVLAASFAFVLGAVAWTAWRGNPALIDADDARLVSLGQRVYGERCASCHGAKLEGQPAWRERRADGRLPAPPHDASGHTWHHTDAVLIELVSVGLQVGRFAPRDYISDMSGFANILSEEEIRASLAYIKSTWPKAERDHQARVTREANTPQR